MKLQHIVTTHESESSLRGHLAAYLEKAGYRPVSVHPFLVYRRGSLLSSLFALSPKSQRATVSIEIKPADDLTTAALLSLEAKTEGEFVLDSKGRFWQDEFEGMVAAASSGTTASDAATGHTEARFDLKQTASVEAGLKMQSRLAGGASWFYVVAALSLVNTLVFVSGGNLQLSRWFGHHTDRGRVCLRLCAGRRRGRRKSHPHRRCRDRFRYRRALRSIRFPGQEATPVGLHHRHGAVCARRARVLVGQRPGEHRLPPACPVWSLQRPQGRQGDEQAAADRNLDSTVSRMSDTPSVGIAGIGTYIPPPPSPGRRSPGAPACQNPSSRRRWA